MTTRGLPLNVAQASNAKKQFEMSHELQKQGLVLQGASYAIQPKGLHSDYEKYGYYAQPSLNYINETVNHIIPHAQEKAQSLN